MAGLGTGALAAGAAGGWLYWRRPWRGAVVHLHVSGDEASAAGAFRLKLAHPLGRLLPQMELSAAQDVY